MIKKFEVGDKVRIIKEPTFITFKNNKIWDIKSNSISEDSHLAIADMSHLVGLTATVTGFIPNMFGDRLRNLKEGIGFYILDVEKSEKGRPRGLEFTPEDLEKIEE
jgi:hypothetical protein